MTAKGILTIEDDDGVAEIVEAVLEDAGYAVERTASADEGPHFVHAARFDLVLLDMSPIGMSGRAFLQACKGDPTLAYLPIVVMSGARVQTSAGEPSPDGQIQKPFDIDEVCRVVDHFTGSCSDSPHGASA